MSPYEVTQLGEWQQVIVRWRDAYSPHSGWHEVDDYVPEDAVAISIGRVWKDCQEHYLTLVGTIFETEDNQPKTVGDINHIPVGMILSVEKINGTPQA